MSEKNKYSLRSFINDTHLWLGLASGIILFVVCLTGTVLVFEKEIKEFSAKNVILEPTSSAININELLVAAKTSNKGYVTGITIPIEQEKPYEFTVKKDITERRGTLLLINPYSQKIIETEKNPADGFMMFMFKLHRWLLLDISIGRPIVGIATVIFILLAISGIILWFPKKLKWHKLKSGFKIKATKNWKRVNHDLHNTLGFYSCILIVIMGLTGLTWSFESYKEGLSHALGSPIFGKSDKHIEIPKTDNLKEISLNDALIIANKELDYNGKLSISLPNPKESYYQFKKYNKKSWSPETSDNLMVDIYGNIINKEVFNEKPLNAKIAALIKPLHTGTIFGLYSKIIYFIACLIATSLPITGTIIWFNKLKNKIKKTSTVS